MKTPRLVRKGLYFGVDATHLREGAERVLGRVEGIAPDQATVALDALAEEFRLSAMASRALAEAMARDGLLERLSPQGIEYAITPKFRLYAQAAIVDPLPRSDADLLLKHTADLAAHFNRTAASNRYEIREVAVFGDYMNRDARCADISLGITVRRRPPAEKALFGRAAKQVHGHEHIRQFFERQSEFMRVRFFLQLSDVPRPFKVIFKADA